MAARERCRPKAKDEHTFGGNGGGTSAYSRIVSSRRSHRMRSTFAVTLIASLLCAGCQSGSPLAPPFPPAANPQAAPTALPPIPPVVLGGPAASALAISSFTAHLFQRTAGAVFQYSPATLALSETTGQSGVTVHSIDVISPRGQIERDCPTSIGGSIRIGPGQTQDLVRPVSYCMAYSVANSEETELTVRVGFVDDEGREGGVERVISVAGCTLGGRTGLIVCQ